MLSPDPEKQQLGNIYSQVWLQASPFQVSLDPLEQFLREQLLRKRVREFFILISLDKASGRFTIDGAKEKPSGPSLLAYFPVKLSLFNLEKDPFWLIDNDSISDSFYNNWSFDEGFLAPFWLKWAFLNLANRIDHSTYQFLTYPFALPKYLLKQNKRGQIPPNCKLSLPLFSETDFVRFASVPIDPVGTTVIEFPGGPRVYYSAASVNNVLDLSSKFAGSGFAESQPESIKHLRSSLLALAMQGGGFLNLQIPPIVLESQRDTLLLFLFMTASGVYLRKNINHLNDQFKKFEPICEEARRLGLRGLCVVRHGDGPFGVTTLVLQLNDKFFRVDLPELLRLRALQLDEANSSLGFIFSRKLVGLHRQDCLLSFDPEREVFILNPSPENLGLKRHYALDLEWTKHKLLWFGLYQALDRKLSEKAEHNLAPPKISRQASFFWLNQAPYLFAQANLGVPYENFFGQSVFPDWSKQASENRKPFNKGSRKVSF